jgi:hypothetical protein
MRARGFPSPHGLRTRLSHTPAIRQWACIVALLLGLAGNGYTWTVRPRIPVPIERRLDSAMNGERLVRTLEWWCA